MRTRAGLLLSIALPAALSAQWQSQVSKDEMTNEVQAMAYSPDVEPTRAMKFPYADTQAWLAFACDGKIEWAYVGFSKKPNLLNTQTHDGFNTFSTRVKWGDEIKEMSFMQKWGGSFIQFEDGKKAIANMTAAAADSVLVELDWFGNGTVYFRFSLEGASDAIAQARASCKK